MKYFHCLFVKILCIMLIIVSITSPFILFALNPLKFSLWYIFSFISILLIYYVILKMMYRGLLSTNNPADRKNIFSINRRFSGTMNGSAGENGIGSIILQEPTLDEIKHLKNKIRKLKLKKIEKGIMF